MPKRKRAAPSPSPDASANLSRAIATQRKLSAQRLQTAQKELSTALRLAASFERQKHGRRVKTARENKDDNALARLAKEQNVLKRLDMDKRATEHLKRTVARVKSLTNAEGLPKGWSAEDLKNEVKEKEDTLVLNVKARLFKVDAVRKVVDEVVDDLKEIVGAKAKVPVAGKDRAKKARVESNEDDSDGSAEEESDEDDVEGFGGFNARVAAPSSGEEDESDDSLEDDHRPPSVVDSEREYVIDEEEESNDEDNEIGDEISGSGSDIAIPANAIAPSDDLDNEFSDPEEMSDAPRPKAKSKTKAESKPTKSTFLPSLSHAAYFSGSDSESPPSDLDADLGAPKKNRRGQRARQKIWEKKYGEKAKHVKKEDRNQGWDSKRGAVDSSRDRRGGGGGSHARGRDGGGRGGNRAFASGENAMPVKKKETKRDDVGTLHPSWAAAKAAKDKKIGVKPEGKKVVFD